MENYEDKKKAERLLSEFKQREKRMDGEVFNFEGAIVTIYGRGLENGFKKYFAKSRLERL